MSMQRLRNAVIEAEARGFRLYLRPEGVEIIARFGVESWHRLASWPEMEQAATCPVCENMELIGREIIEIRRGLVS